MAFNQGSVAILLLNAVDYSQYLDSAALDMKVDSAETSALGTTAKTYVPGLREGTFKLDGMYDPTVDAALNGFVQNASVPFDYRPAGTGTGKPKYTGNCIMTDYSIDTSVKDMAGIKASFQVTGTITRGVQ